MKTGDFEQTWAEALVAHLVANKGIELRDGLSPVAEVAKVLPDAAKVPAEGSDAWDDLGEELLDALVDATSVDEVFVDEAELAVIARTTRPGD